jgi:FdrA protein
MLLMGEHFPDIYSNLSHTEAYKTCEVVVKGHHTAMDLGDDHFTMGRPHPMIDGSLRDDYILQVAADPETAVLLLDVVLGYGAAADPAGELAPVLEKAQEIARKNGGELAIVTYVCGTELDVQGKAAQIEKLRQTGALVTATNAQAVRIARRIADGRNI